MPETISAPKTKIEICSLAATVCGKSSFNTIDAGGAFAADLDKFFDTLVSAEIGSNRWKFCQNFQTMNILNTLNPSFDSWQYYWVLPADAVMVHYVDPSIDYIVFGDKVLTKTKQPATIIYSRTIPVSKWPPAFAMYIVFHLASLVGMSITNSDRMLARIDEGLKLWQSRALFSDSQSSRTDPLRHNPYIDVRYRTRTRRG